MTPEHSRKPTVCDDVDRLDARCSSMTGSGSAYGHRSSTLLAGARVAVCRSACGDSPQAGSRWAERTPLAKGSNIGRGTAKTRHETARLGQARTSPGRDLATQRDPAGTIPAT
jgi:hypothetical protein